MNNHKRYINLQYFRSFFGCNQQYCSCNRCADWHDTTINSTIAPLEAALSAVNANDLEEALKHIATARQASKEITGSSVAPKASRASAAIVKARRYVKEGDTEKAAAALKEALLILNSIILHRPSETKSFGGL